MGQITLAQMKMNLCEIYVTYYRRNAPAGLTWKQHVESEYIQRLAMEAFTRMGKNIYVVHIPRWMSHLGSFYAQKTDTGINILRDDGTGENVVVKVIPVNLPQ